MAGVGWPRGRRTMTFIDAPPRALILISMFVVAASFLLGVVVGMKI